MKGAGQALRQAVYRLLNEDVALTNVIQGIGDWVDVNTTYPYITIQPISSGEPFDVQDKDGLRGVFLVHVWNDDRGFKEVLEIGDMVIDIIEKRIPPTSNGFLIQRTGKVEIVNTFEEDEGGRKHVIVRAEFFIREV